MAESGGAGGEQRAIARRAGIVGAGTLLSRALGLVRDQTMAALFAVAETDAFWVAFRIPNALRQLLAEGAVSSAVVPVLSKATEEGGNEEAKRTFASVRGVSLFVLVVVTIAGVVLARPLVELFAGGYASRPEEMERTVTLARWVFPYIFFMGTAALGAAALNVNRLFFAAAFAPGLLNVALVVAAFVMRAPLARRGLDPTLALAVGVLLGGALQVAVQLPSLWSIGWLGIPRFRFSDPRVVDVGRRILPMTFGLGIYYVDLVVCTRLLSGLGEGAQSWFSWAQRLCDFPQGIFVMALQTAALPSLATFAARGDRDELARTFAFGMRLSLFVSIPVTAAFVALSEPLVAAVFQRGKFGIESVHETARQLVAQGAGVWTVAAVRQLVPVFHALGDTRTPVVVSAIDLVALIVLALVIRGPLGHAGIGWAVTGSSFVQMTLLWALLARRTKTNSIDVAASAARTTVASIAAALAGAFAAKGWPAPSSPSEWTRPLPGITGLVAFAVVFLLVAFAVRSPELRAISSGLARRLRRR